MRVTAFEMRAVGQPLVRVERELRAPRAGEAVVRVLGCGVCHTDLGFLFEGVPTRHELPLVLGHEVAGVVVAGGDGTDVGPGTPVIVPAVIPCGRCRTCQRGRGDICRSQVFPGNDDHGGFSSHLVVPASGLCPVRGYPPETEGFARLAVAADAVSTAFAAVRKSELGEGDLAVFIGVGGVGGFAAQIAKASCLLGGRGGAPGGFFGGGGGGGALAAQIAKASGARVLALDVDDERLALLRAHGADWTLNVRGRPAKDVKASVRDLAKAEGLPGAEWRIFETSGTAPGQELAFALLNHGARLGVVGYHPGDVSVRLSNLMAFAARADGTWGCPPDLFPIVLDLVASGRVVLEPFVELHPMSTANEVLDRLRRGELRRRPVLVPDFGA